MNQAEREHLRNLIDQARRTQIPPPACAGCGAEYDHHTQGCEACYHRHASRQRNARRARQREETTPTKGTEQSAGSASPC